MSFSICFWLGLFGMLCHVHVATPARATRIAMILIAVFACANALQLMHRAKVIGTRTRATAATIRTTWPQVDTHLLARIYFDQPQVARQRLQRLRAWGYAPFDAPAAAH